MPDRAHNHAVSHHKGGGATNPELISGPHRATEQLFDLSRLNIFFDLGGISAQALSDLKRAGMLDIPNQHQLILKDVDGLSELADSIE